ncbi:MAG: pyridoxal-phosphate dependent enzyme [Minisyncoccia bacterium]
MNARQKLLDHPYWVASYPSKMRLVRVFDFPPEANPFAKDGVVIRIAAAPGESPFHKGPMARQGILEGVRKGLIGPDTIVVEATSGNTGLGMAVVCTNLGLNFVAVIPNDIPESKISGIRALGEHVRFESPKAGETTVGCARRLGKQEGSHNPDQYAGWWNPQSHYEHLMPQLFSQTQASIFAAPGGTTGTCIAAKKFALDNRLSMEVVPVLCAEDQEIPAVRTLARVKKDIRLPWEAYFDEEKDLQFATRHASFFCSFFTWRFVPVQLGPSFGAAFVGALKFLREHKEAGTLDQFRKKDGKIYVVVFGPDDYRAYVALYLDKPFYGKDFRSSNLLDFIDWV